MVVPYSKVTSAGALFAFTVPLITTSLMLTLYEPPLTEGADGLAFMTIFPDDAETQPEALVTVNV